MPPPSGSGSPSRLISFVHPQVVSKPGIVIVMIEACHRSFKGTSQIGELVGAETFPL